MRLEARLTLVLSIYYMCFSAFLFLYELQQRIKYIFTLLENYCTVDDQSVIIVVFIYADIHIQNGHHAQEAYGICPRSNNHSFFICLLGAVAIYC